MRRIGGWLGLCILAGCGGEVTSDGGLDGGRMNDSGMIDAESFDTGVVEVDAEVDAGMDHDAGPPEPCETAGTLETVACGMCGTTERFCTADLVWEYAGCEDEGECAPGTLGEVACGLCGAQNARCLIDCTWEATGACSDEGTCAPGSIERTSDGCPSGQFRDVVCADACEPVPGPCAADTCGTPGMTETISCGMCGSMQRFCSIDLTWSYGPCEDEGECAPGTMRTGPCGSCGTGTQQCTSACTWVSSGACSGEGECFPGQRTTSGTGCPAGQTRTLLCNDTCSYVPETACMACACDPGETCIGGTCYCGGSAGGCPLGHTCTSGACYCGTRPGTCGLYRTCNAGTCVCLEDRGCPGFQSCQPDGTCCVENGTTCDDDTDCCSGNCEGSFIDGTCRAAP